MKRSAVPTVVLLAALALVALLVYGVVQRGDHTTLDDAIKRGERPTAPGATRQLPVLGSDSQKQSLADYRGKVVVLNFWASWCPPCVREAPVLERAQKTLAGDGTGTILAATYNDAPDRSKEFARKHRFDFPIVRDVGTQLADEYGTRSLPETFVLDRKGRIVAISRGEVSDTFLQAAIAKAKASS